MVDGPPVALVVMFPHGGTLVSDEVLYPDRDHIPKGLQRILVECL